MECNRAKRLVKEVVTAVSKAGNHTRLHAAAAHSSHAGERSDFAAERKRFFQVLELDNLAQFGTEDAAKLGPARPILLCCVRHPSSEKWNDEPLLATVCCLNFV